MRPHRELSETTEGPGLGVQRLRRGSRVRFRYRERGSTFTSDITGLRLVGIMLEDSITPAVTSLNTAQVRRSNCWVKGDNRGSDIFERLLYLGIFSSLEASAGTKRCNGGENESGRDKQSSLKRSRRQTTPPNQTEGSSQGEDSSSDHPSKRLRGSKQSQSKALRPPASRPFACPYYKHDATEYIGCMGWHDAKLSRVKEHCKEQHLKHFQCGRCRVFRAGRYDEIKHHLESENCKKSDIIDPSGNDAIEKAKGVGKAKTWQKIYEILFPLQIPNPFWVDQVEAPNEPPENYDVASVEYPPELPGSSQAHLALEEGLNYNGAWVQSPLSPQNIRDEDSGIDNPENNIVQDTIEDLLAMQELFPDGSEAPDSWNPPFYLPN